MNIIGIIVEYNPFHNGHIYHIEKIKEMYPNSIIIACMSGYFTERGNISILSKEDKTKIALNNNIDLVVELPFVFTTQSSDNFAYKAIEILNKFKIDTLIFGSECNDIKKLTNLVIEQEKEGFDELVKYFLDQGINYPTALAKATDKTFTYNANDLLAISYIKAVRKINKNIKCITIKRTNDYHDTSLDSNIVSASNIRERIKNNEDITPYVPIETKSLINNVSNDNLFNLLKFKILTDKDLSIYLDVDEGIENRILKYIHESKTIDELISNIKTKRYTYNKINRMLLHIIISLTKEDNKLLKLDYVKILGFNSKGKTYLKSIRKELDLGTYKDSLVYKYELKSAYLYEEATKKSLRDFDKKNIPIEK